ncbi:hypothetical protein [Flavobacterium columnare]|uniref:hypothetical protein n=1 Tax=Flavobacterium columnare TaxID=996 RepID=UPI0002434B44|nr:hypothetical protein [Flavobacterium columnare]
MRKIKKLRKIKIGYKEIITKHKKSHSLLNGLNLVAGTGLEPVTLLAYSPRLYRHFDFMYA